MSLPPHLALQRDVALNSLIYRCDSIVMEDVAGKDGYNFGVKKIIFQAGIVVF